MKLSIVKNIINFVPGITILSSLTALGEDGVHEILKSFTSNTVYGSNDVNV